MVMQIIPTPYVGKGLLDDDDRNNILSQFAGGLLQGYNVNPTPVMGQYFTPIGGGTPTVTSGNQDQATQLTPDEFARMVQDYRNEQNLLNESSAADDFAPTDGPFGPGGFGPPEAEPGVYDGNFFDFMSDPKGLGSLFSAPVGAIGLARGAYNAYRDYQDMTEAAEGAYDTSQDDRELAGGAMADMGDFEF
jgi:hypothetical protein